MTVCEKVVVHCDHGYNEDHTDEYVDPQFAVFKNATLDHVLLTVVDPRKGTSMQIMLRKDSIPKFVLADADSEENK